MWEGHTTLKWDTPEQIKRNLELYRKLKRMVLSLCREAREVSSTMVTDKVKGSSKEFPYAKRSYTVEGVFYRKVDRLENAIREGNAKLRDIEQFVDGIDDVLVQQAVRMHYIRGETWQRVSMDLMGSRSEATARMMVFRYFEKLCSL